MSNINVGALGLDLKINGQDYKKQIKQYGDYGSNQLQSSFGSAFKSIGKMAVAAFSIGAITKFTASCLKLGSDLAEVQNVVDVAFPSMNQQINDFAKNAMTQFGLSETVAKRYTGTFGAMAKAFGFTEKASADMSMELTGLAGDVASFYNMNTDEAYTKLKSVFTGETETLKELGVVMTQNALDQYALANGYGMTTARMSEQEKVALRMKFVTDQLSLASGDFIRTQDSWANQTRVLSLRFDQLKASLGKGFIAIFTPIVKGINWVLSNLQPLADSFASLMEMLTGTTSSASSAGGALADTSSDLSSASDNAGGLSDGLSDAGKSGEKAAKKIQKAFSKIDTINKLTFGSDSDAGTGGSGAGGGSGGGSDGGSVADAVDFPKANKEATVFDGMLDGIIKEFQRLGNIFKNGFVLGFGDSFKNIEKIKEYIGSIGNSIASIFTDEKVVFSFKKLIDSWAFGLGSFIGSVSSIGVTFATLFVGSIATYLEKNVNFIKDRLVSSFNVLTHSNTILGFFYATIADIASVFASKKAIKIGSNFIEIIFNSMMMQVELFLKVADAIISGIVEPIISNKDSIKKAIEQLLNPLGEVASRIAEKISGIDMSAFNNVITNIKGTVSGLVFIFGNLLSCINTFFISVLNGITTLWDNGLSVFIDNVSSFILNIINGVMSIWNNAVNPLINLLLDTFLPIFTTVFDGMLAIAIPIIEKIMEYVNMFLEVCNVVVGFLNDHVWPMFKTVFNGLSEIVRGFWDFVSPIFAWFMDLLGNVVKFVLDYFLAPLDIAFHTVVGIIKDIADPIGKVFDGVKKTFQGIIDFVTGIFTGDWRKAWNGIKEIFSGVWNSLSGIVDAVWRTITGLFSRGGEIFSGVVDGIAETFKRIVNCIIDGINKVISFPFNKINGILNDIRGLSFLGISPFDWIPYNALPVPRIPMLAQGGYVKANQPQLAMIGDNRHQGEVVAPEDKMVDMIDTALKMQKSNGSVDGLDRVIALIIQLIEAVKSMTLKVDIDMKKMAILLDNAQKERAMIGG